MQMKNLKLLTLLLITSFQFSVINSFATDTDTDTVAIDSAWMNRILSLGGVTVKGRLPKTRIKGGALRTTVAGSILENVGSAKDVLSKTPGIKTGQNGLEVIGKGTPQIYINGRKVTDDTELERLQSNDIQSVEVITNPGAEYDATVRSVVIIRTVRRQGDGLGFSLNASDDQSLWWSNGYQPQGSLNLNYRTGGVDIFGGVDYTRHTMRQKSHIEKATFASHLIENKGELLAENVGQTLHTNAGINWQISDSHSLGGKIEWGKKFQRDMRTVIRDNVFEDGTLTDRITTTSDDKLGDDGYHSIGANLYYNGIVNRKLGIDVNIDYYGTDLNEHTTSHEASTMTHDADIFGRTDNTGRLCAAKAVLSYPVWKGSLKAGTEETFSRRRDNYSVDGIDIPTSRAKVREDNYAGFLSYGCQLPKVGLLSAGLRYEFVRYNYRDQLDPEATLSRSYSNFFPSLSFASKVGPVQYSLTYNAKTTRPKYDNLSSAVRYNSRYIWQSGNARLQPELSHSVGIMAMWQFISLSVNYTRTNDAIMIWSSPMGDDGVVLVKPRNIESPFRTLEAFVSLSPSVGPLTMTYTLGVQPQWLTINAPDPREPSGIRRTSFNGRPIGFCQLQNALGLAHNWQLELNGTLQSTGYTENLYVKNAYFDLTTAVQKKLLRNGALVLRLEAHDILSTARYNVNSDFGSHTISQTNRMDTQKIKFSLRYSFNTTQSKYRGTGAGKDQKARM